MIFRQLFDKESSTYTYLLACDATKEAVIIDPVVEQAERDAGLARELGVTVKYALNTHCHADHITGTAKLRELIGCKSLISEASGAKADVHVKPGDEIKYGSRVRMRQRHPAPRIFARGGHLTRLLPLLDAVSPRPPHPGPHRRLCNLRFG